MFFCFVLIRKYFELHVLVTSFYLVLPMVFLMMQSNGVLHFHSLSCIFVGLSWGFWRFQILLGLTIIFKEILTVPHVWMGSSIPVSLSVEQLQI